MARVLIELPKETLEALHELAGIIKQDPEEKNQLAVLLRRCVRTYEWIVYQQSHGKTIAATTPDEIQYLRDGGFTEESDFVERLYSAGQRRSSTQILREGCIEIRDFHAPPCSLNSSRPRQAVHD